MRKYSHNWVQLLASIVQENIALPLIFINKLNLLFFQNLKNVDIVYIFFINEFFHLF